MLMEGEKNKITSTSVTASSANKTRNKKQIPFFRFRFFGFRGIKLNPPQANELMTGNMYPSTGLFHHTIFTIGFIK